MSRQDHLISYFDLEQAGWPAHIADDYLGLKRELQAVTGTAADPNGNFTATLNGFYVNTSTNQLWFSPAPGTDDEWIQLI